MAIIKKSELKQLNVEQLKEKLNDLKKELMKINAKLSTKTTPENPGRIKAIKKTIARIYTIMHKKKFENKNIELEKTKEKSSQDKLKSKTKEVKKK